MRPEVQLVLPHRQEEELLRHALDEYPREAVGLLGGSPDGLVQTVTPLLNVAGERAFFVDPLSQFRALREYKTAGLFALAVYHSHPDGGVGLSKRDLQYAAHLDLLQLVIAVHPDKSPAIRVAAFEVSRTCVARRVGVSTESALAEGR